MRFNGITEQGDFGASNLGGMFDDIGNFITKQITPSASAVALTDAQKKLRTQKIAIIIAICVAAYVAYVAAKKRKLI